jgi:tetratricopeptide (TPR) repeat protein
MAKKTRPVIKNNLQTKEEWIEFLLSSWHPYLLLSVLGLIVYGKSILFGFVFFDDDTILINNYNLISGFNQLWKIFTSATYTYYRPILIVSFLFDAQISQISPWMYHISNLLYHFAAVFLMFYIMLHMQYSRRLSFLLSGVFLVHPLLSQAVAWIPGRNDPLVTIFILLSFLFFIKYIVSKQFSHLVLHELFFLLALFTKETALVFPFFCILYLFMQERPWIRLKEFRYLAITWTAIAIVWFAIRKIALSGVLVEEEYSLRAFFANIPVLMEFIGKMFLPLRQSPYAILGRSSTIIGTAITFFIFLFVFLNRKIISRRGYLYLFWVLLFIIPSLFMLIYGYDHRFRYLEHRAYLPMAGLAFFIADFAASVNKEKLYNLLCGTLSVIIVLFGFRTFIFSENFANRMVFWKSACDLSSECPDVYTGIGLAYNFSGDPDKATASFKTSVDMAPQVSNYHNHLGYMYAIQNKLDEAEKEFNAAIKTDSTRAVGYSNLGFLHYQKNDPKRAEELYLKALTVEKNFPDALNKLMELYYRQHRYDESLVYARKLEAIDAAFDKQLLFHIVMQE